MKVLEMENDTMQNFTVKAALSSNHLPPQYMAEIALTSTALSINIPLIIIILTHRQLRRTKSHQIFVNILMIHRVHSICFIPAILDKKAFFFYVYAVISQGLLIELFISMMALVIERFLAVKYPLAYNNMKGKYVFMMLTGTWLLPSIFIGFALHYRITRVQYILLGTIFLPITGFILGFSNIAIYFIMKKHEKFVRMNTSQPSIKTKGKNMMKPSFICFGLVLSFIILWSQYFIRQILLLSNVYNPKTDGNGFSDISVFTAHLNSLIDPLTFIYLSSPVKKLMKLKFSKKSIRTFSTSTIIETGL